MSICSHGGRNALFLADLLKVFTHFGPGSKSVGF